MKRNVILWIILGSLLLTSMAGCQREPVTLTDSSAMAVVSEDSSLPDELASSLEPVSSAEPVSSEDTSSEGQSVSSQAENSQIASAIQSHTSSPVSQSPSREETTSYVYSNKVAEQMQKVDPANPPEFIYVFLTPAASDADKTYDSSYFLGIDVTVISKRQQGGMPMYDVVTSERIDNPLEIVLSLKVNTSGWENFQKVVMALDCRDDISEISFEQDGVYAN